MDNVVTTNLDILADTPRQAIVAKVLHQRHPDLTDPRGYVVTAQAILLALDEADSEHGADIDALRARDAIKHVTDMVTHGTSEPLLHHAVVELRRFVDGKDHGHHYLSTSCLHATKDNRPELHGECQIDTSRYDGSHKIGATCKWCPARCVCTCHNAADQA